jgi:hypothetical protein
MLAGRKAPGMDEGLLVDTDKKAIITPDYASARGSIVKTNKAGLLARNLFAALPIPATG